MNPAVQFAATADGVRVAYSVSGRTGRRCILYMPPLPFRHVEREWQLPEDRRWIERLGAARTVVRYDPRGLGLSSREASAFSLDTLAHDVTAVLDATAGEEPAVLLACLNSAPVAVRYARLHPHRVSHLILWSPVAAMSDSVPPQVRTLLTVADKDWHLFTQAAAHVMVGWDKGDAAVRYAEYLRACVTPDAMRSLLDDAGNSDIRDDLARLSVPTLVLHRRGIATVPQASVTTLAAHVPNARLSILEGDVLRPGVGDMEAAAGAVDAFLGDNAAAAADDHAEDTARGHRAAPAAGPRHAFRREGDYWTLVFNGEVTRVRDAKGLHHIARLLREPDRELAALELVGEHDGGRAIDEDAGPILDANAKQAYRTRLTELRARLDDAHERSDSAAAAAARAEIEAIEDQLSAAVGLGGRDRRASATSERARLTVTKRIRDAIDRIRTSHPSLARHLSNTIRTGHLCSYHPEAGRAPDWLL